ncbi:MAG: hypothetical protein ACD_51C00070G0005 [uncultured bacterium]|nr:MAG: hypothetical protein ACD_51C00070G0005 [uncultured bacterium]OGJ47008.1 MAG: hypothetical protein A2244_04690 [Candidatus Peregrinibacteria bacterium RIFOXYA2_FULL_41_18]OGJ47746.1 MAG: hypothetical protein A2344_00885 [Candidatus Peregrinibacteria bacterium RIFOXYB12_FULL_41_12]
MDWNCIKMVEKPPLKPTESDKESPSVFKRLSITFGVQRALDGLKKLLNTTGDSHTGNLKDVFNRITPSPETIVDIRQRLNMPETHITEYNGIRYLCIPIRNTADRRSILEALFERKVDKFEPVYRSVTKSINGEFIEIPISEIRSGDYADEIAQIEKFYEISLFRAEFSKYNFNSYPDSDSLESYRNALHKFGNQDFQAEYHFENRGKFPVITDSNAYDVVEQLTESGKMIKVDDVGSYHLLGNVYGEVDPELPSAEKEKREQMAKHVYASSYKLLEGMGQAINEDLHKRGMMAGATVKIPVGALIRTREYSDHLADIRTEKGPKKYPYATKVKTDKDGEITEASSHVIGDAIDATFSRVVVCSEGDICFAITEEENPELVRGVRAIAAKYLLDNVKQGKALGILEPNNVLHFVGVEERVES